MASSPRGKAHRRAQCGQEAAGMEFDDGGVGAVNWASESE